MKRPMPAQHSMELTGVDSDVHAIGAVPEQSLTVRRARSVAGVPLPVDHMGIVPSVTIGRRSLIRRVDVDTSGDGRDDAAWRPRLLPPDGRAHRFGGLLRPWVEDLAVVVHEAGGRVAENPRDDLRGHTLGPEYRGTRATQLAGLPTGQTRLLRDPVEDPAEVRRVDGPARLGSEDEATVLPGVADKESFGRLADLVRSQRRYDLSWEIFFSPALCSPRRADDKTVLHPRNGRADGDDAVVEVDVSPTEAEDLAFSKAEAEQQNERRLQSLAVRGVEKRAGLLRRQGATLGWDHSGSFGERDNVSGNHPPALGLAEGLAEHAADELDRAGRVSTSCRSLDDSPSRADGARKSRLLLLAEEHLHIHGGQRDEPLASENGNDVSLADDPVVAERRSADPTRNDIAEPAAEQLFDGYAAVLCRETSGDLEVDLLHLAEDFGLGLPVDDPSVAMPVLAIELDRADPSAVGLTAIDRTFALPATLGSDGARGHCDHQGLLAT